MAEEITFLGFTNFRNQKKKFGIKTDDRRRHVYIVGKTGMGKSELLKNMAVQDILSGRGVGFIDPHGESAQELLDFIPSNRVNDVIYFNPADLDFPITFNVMEKVGMEQRHLVASGLMGVFKKIWPDVWSARMEYILNNTILALLEYPNSTLLGVNRMLADTEYRKKVVEKISDPVVKAFWTQEYARYTQRYEIEATAAIQNKVGQFISNPLIRNLIGQVKSKINMRDFMDEQKILIANLSKGKIGEDNSKLLGALLITKIQLAAMSRVDVPEQERKDFYLYVDEFQNFATESFADILSEARKYKLNLTLANQYMAQLEEMTASGRSTKVRDAIFGNVGTIIAFRVGAEDAEYLEKEFVPEFLAADLVNLGKYSIYLKLLISGVASRPFSAETMPPFEKSEKSNREKIIIASRERYGIPREIVEDKISRWAEAGITRQPSPAERPAPAALYDAKCSACGRQIKVIFPPDGVRPTYCKACLKKEQERRAVPPQIPPQTSPRISLQEVQDSEPISFSPPKKEGGELRPKTKRKEVDLDEVKKALEKALKKNI